MGDMAEVFNLLKERKREQRKLFGVNCPVCTERLPKAHPTIMLPQQVCKICGYKDPRPRSAMREWESHWKRDHET